MAKGYGERMIFFCFTIISGKKNKAIQDIESECVKMHVCEVYVLHPTEQ